MEKFGPDVLRSIALYLSLEDLLHFCSISLRFKTICNDDYFWRNKLLHDFPNVDIANLKLKDFKPTYFDLYAEKSYIHAQAVQDSYIYDSLYKSRQKQVEELEKQVKNIQIQIDKLREVGPGPRSKYFKKLPAKKSLQINQLIVEKDKLLNEIAQLKESADIREQYEIKADKIIRRANELKALAGTIYDNHYYEIKLDHMPLEGMLMDFDYGIYKDFKIFKRRINDYVGYLNLKNGTLIGISDRNNPANELPNLLIYVYEDKEWPYNLHVEGYIFPSNRNINRKMPHMITMMADRKISFEDLTKIYNLPFILPNNYMQELQKIQGYETPEELSEGYDDYSQGEESEEEY